MEFCTVTNEELAVLIREGRDDLMPVLWEQVRGWVTKLALRWYHAFDGRCGVELGDLINAGYIAVVKAVQTFDPAASGFLTWLTYRLKTVFCEAYGVRRRVRDPLNGAESLDAPLSADDPSGATLWDTIPGSGEQDFTELEEKLWNEQLHEALENALQCLDDDEQWVIRAKYYAGISFHDQAKERGVSYQRIADIADGALEKIRRKPSIIQKLSCFLPCRSFDPYRGTGFSAWKVGGSVEERFLLI